MKKVLKILLIFLSLLFVSSFFLPAYGSSQGTPLKGYMCAFSSIYMALRMALDFGIFSSWIVPYLFVFIIDNLLTCFFIFSLFSQKALSIDALKWMGGFLVMHILSWMIIHLPYNGIKSIEVGYYLWAFSMIAIWVLYCRKVKNGSENFDSVKRV